MSKKCIACGAELEDNARFCDECGVEQKEIIEQNRIQEAKVENTEPKVVRVSSGAKESSWRGFISLVLGIISIFAKNSICAGISIFLAVTVMFAKRRKKGAAICGILLSVLALAVIIPDVEGEEGYIAEENKDDGIMKVINDGITDVEQMVYGTPIDLFLETTSAFDLYSQIGKSADIQVTAIDSMGYASEFDNYKGNITVKFYSGDYGPFNQLNYAAWKSDKIDNSTDAEQLVEKIISAFSNRYGEYDEEQENNDKIYHWELNNQDIRVIFHDSYSIDVTVSTTYLYDYYENGSYDMYEWFDEETDPFYGEINLFTWVGTYENMKGDIIDIEISTSAENEYGMDVLKILLQDGESEIVELWCQFDGRSTFYWSETESYTLAMSSDKNRISLMQNGHFSYDYSGVYTRKDNGLDLHSENVHIEDVVSEQDLDGAFNANYTISDAADILQEKGFIVDRGTTDGREEYIVNDGALRWYTQDGKDVLHIEDIGETTFYICGISPKMEYEDACEQVEVLGGFEDLGYIEEEGCRGYDSWLYEIYIYPKDEGGISIVFKK